MQTNEKRTRFYRTLTERFRTEVIAGKLYLIPRFSLDDVAARLGESRYNVSRAVNECLGTNFHQFVNELRIAEAVRLMQTPEGGKLKIRLLAPMAGFSDRKHFMRVCKRITGLSPTELKTKFNNTTLN